MDIAIAKDEGKSQVTLTVTVTPEELEPYLDRAAKTLSKTTPLKGFRPGKASMDVAMEAFGKDRVLSEALTYAVPRWFVQAVVEHTLDALGQPVTTIKTASLEEGVVFTALVDVLPSVVLGDIAAIMVTRRQTPITDADVDRELGLVAKSRSTYLDVARPAVEGDTVTVDFSVTLNGELMDGGSSKNHPVHLGEGHFVPDFERQLIGISAGDQREFTIVFPDDFANASLRGRQAQATVAAHSVQKRVIPELTDEFARRLGRFTDLATLRTQLQNNLQADRDEREQERRYGELTDQLATTATFAALPKSLVEREIDRRIDELTQMLTYQQKTLANYLQDRQITPETLRVELTEPAERTVKVSLALRQFAQEQNIIVTDEEVAQQLETLRSDYPQPKLRSDVDQDELLASVAHSLRNRKALARLEALATVVNETAIASKSKPAPAPQ